jgi:hypothetical protein
MDQEDLEHLQALRLAYAKRLRVLELREAQLGHNTPADVVIAIDEIRETIAKIDVQLSGTKTALQTIVKGTFSLQNGLANLKSHFQSTRQDDSLIAFYTLEARLLENLQEEKDFGSTETSRHNQARIVDALNNLAYDKMTTTFLRLCKSSNFWIDFSTALDKLWQQIPSSDQEMVLTLSVLEFRLIRIVLDEQKSGLSSETLSEKRKVIKSINDMVASRFGNEYLLSV